MITDEQVNAFINAFELNGGHFLGNDEFDNVRKALEAYEQSKPKPEAYGYVKANGYNKNDLWLAEELSTSAKNSDRWLPLYTAPPTREPLTDDEVFACWDKDQNSSDILWFARAIEEAVWKKIC